MRLPMREDLERARLVAGAPSKYCTKPGDPFGMFAVRGPINRALLIVLGNGNGWEHASVSVKEKRGRGRAKLPCWAEMDFIKRMIWDDREAVMQLHVPRDTHVSPGSDHGIEVLHLWKPTDAEIPLPTVEMV